MPLPTPLHVSPFCQADGYVRIDTCLAEPVRLWREVHLAADRPAASGLSAALHGLLDAAAWRAAVGWGSADAAASAGARKAREEGVSRAT